MRPSVLGLKPLGATTTAQAPLAPVIVKAHDICVTQRTAKLLGCASGSPSETVLSGPERDALVNTVPRRPSAP